MKSNSAFLATFFCMKEMRFGERTSVLTLQAVLASIFKCKMENYFQNKTIFSCITDDLYIKKIIKKHLIFF